MPATLPPATGEAPVPRVTDRHGTVLSITFRNRWNLHDTVAFHEVPPLLRQAFVTAEDRRFFSHRGVDWRARLAAVVQNLRSFSAVRGASTLTEQAVRILHPRPRTLWSRWLEGFEARRLEARFSKAEILEFYLNQVPYASRRRGVAAAARAYFDRDLGTLSPKEMLALAVLVRSPSRLDPARGTEGVEAPLQRLADRMHEDGLLGDPERRAIAATPLTVAPFGIPVDAGHFVRHVHDRLEGYGTSHATVATTLDGLLQRRVQAILDRRLADLAGSRAADGAVLVVEHGSGEVLAWVDSGGSGDHPGGRIDKVLILRQPGSTLKPFLYALALEDGWTPATLIDDEPLVESVAHGLHDYRNYGRHFYGPLRLREALGNSLNTPAVRTAQFVGRERFLTRLRELGFGSLREHPDVYGDGLALGTGEVRLVDLVSAYATLARGGESRPLVWSLDGPAPGAGRRVFSPEVASQITDVLADPAARRLEFGEASVLDLPIPAAVKTGTSNDYRDAWALGFSERYTVGVWIGNVDRTPMHEVTGAGGPGLVLRSVFAELHRHEDAGPLYLSRGLERRPICRQSGARPGSSCPITQEWFRPGREPAGRCPLHPDGDPEGHPEEANPAPDGVASEAGARDGGAAPAVSSETPEGGGPPRPRLESPTPGLHIALDPRLPDERERFPFRLRGSPEVDRVEWVLDGRTLVTTAPELLWHPVRGHHTLMARVWFRGSEEPAPTQTVGFLVK
ncbi:MAG: transglycosylase domain-containing protein [Thermoanaerobaculia bacterium]